MNHLYMDNDIFKKVTGRQKLQILYNTKNTIKIFLCIAVMSQMYFIFLALRKYDLGSQCAQLS